MSWVVFAPLAEQDLEEIGDYIHAENPAAALRVIVRIRERCQRLVEMPATGALRPELSANLRSVVVHPYVIFYSVDSGSQTIRVERVLHGARDLTSHFPDN